MKMKDMGETSDLHSNYKKKLRKFTNLKVHQVDISNIICLFSCKCIIYFLDVNMYAVVQIERYKYAFIFKNIEKNTI